MTVTFFKYQGTGNDFILVDNRSLEFPKSDHQLIARLCDRRFGIGADGLILLEHSAAHDFSMVYYNSDGNTSSMCGNGGRCLVAFANYLGLIKDRAVFDAIDGVHEARIQGTTVTLKMIDIDSVEVFDNHVFLNTGSPHHVCHRADLEALDVRKEGAKIRYGAPYHSEGANVNFIEQTDKNTFKVRTYERGVEDETLSCGTGVTACAYIYKLEQAPDLQKIDIQTEGGNLSVRILEKDGQEKVILSGPATYVFEGEVELK